MREMWNRHQYQKKYILIRKRKGRHPSSSSDLTKKRGAQMSTQARTHTHHSAQLPPHHLSHLYLFLYAISYLRN